ncbi:unnamed protein product [Cladocopium goreaui]|uniref:Uncharacterized protein n=1 Tax=Cladocopium goreaui TaxID=2562237 RepID=A0A9P1C5J7_9DINO|nr:unnamed protein product [Cladocopium goreaui]
MDAQPVPQAPPLPPVPPFPAFPESGQRVEQFLDGYERTKGSDQKGKLGDRQWKPNEVDQKSLKGISSHELSPSEAREVWLEREVQSLRSVLDRMADQTSFKSSPYWSQGFQSGAPNQVSVMRASGDRDDIRAQHSLSSAFEVPHDDRAQHSSSGVADLLHAARVLNGASSAPALPLQRRLAAVLLTYRMTVGLCMDLAAVLLTYRMTVGLYMDLTAVLIKYHMTVGLRRHLAVLPEYVLVIGLRAWESFNMMGIIFGILHKKGSTGGSASDVLLQEATQWLKSLRLPQVKVMRVSQLSHEESQNSCALQDPAGEHVEVHVHQGCPMVCKRDGEVLMSKLEAFHMRMVQRWVVLNMIRQDPRLLTNQLDVEMALNVKMMDLWPSLPQDIAMVAVDASFVINLYNKLRRCPKKIRNPHGDLRGQLVTLLDKQEQALVTKDALLFLRMLFVYAICEDVRSSEALQTGLTLEQPEDPARYRHPQEVAEKKFMSVWRCDANFEAGSDDERRTMTMSQRCADSKSWAEWSPGLKAAIVVAIQHRLRKQHQQQVGLLPMHLRQEPDSEQLEDQHQNLQLRPLKATTLEAWRSHYLNDHMPARFREDLGLRKKAVEKEKVGNSSTTMTSGAAIKILTVGSVLVGHAKAMSNATATEDVDFTLVWTAGIILMILGAIYAMQLVTKGIQCCVKRLWRASGSQYDCNDLRRRVFGDFTGDGRPTTRQRAATPSALQDLQHGRAQHNRALQVPHHSKDPRDRDVFTVGHCSDYLSDERDTIGLSRCIE